MKIRITNGASQIIFELNNSKAARELYDQLPLEANVENFGTNEKIFYPPEELDVSDAPPSASRRGCLAYYKPWKSVVMFYGDHGHTDNIYDLGTVISGHDRIRRLFGKLKAEQI